MTLMTARPTADETGLPPNVENVSPGNASATSGVAIGRFRLADYLASS